MVALTNVTVIDGTGTAPKAGQTIVIRNGIIADVGPAARVTVPADARRLRVDEGDVPAPPAQSPPPGRQTR